MKNAKEYFDQYTERRGTRSIKWDGCNDKFGVDPSEEMIPMWIADMDFRCPPKVIEAVTAKAQEGIYGYCVKPDSFYDAIISWVKRRYHWDVKKEWIIFTPGNIGDLIGFDPFPLFGNGRGSMMRALGQGAHVFNFVRIVHIRAPFG